MRLPRARTAGVLAGALLALTGLPVTSAANGTTSARPVPTAAGPRGGAGNSPADARSGISVSIPVIAFPPDVTVHGGRLRTAVLLADPTVTARAVVPRGVGDGCAVDLVQGSPGWLDCAVPPTGPVDVVVALSDGRQVTRAAAARPRELRTRAGRTLR